MLTYYMFLGSSENKADGIMLEIEDQTKKKLKGRRSQIGKILSFINMSSGTDNENISIEDILTIDLCSDIHCPVSSTYQLQFDYFPRVHKPLNLENGKLDLNDSTCWATDSEPDKYAVERLSIFAIGNNLSREEASSMLLEYVPIIKRLEISGHIGSIRSLANVLSVLKNVNHLCIEVGSQQVQFFLRDQSFLQDQNQCPNLSSLETVSICMNIKTYENYLTHENQRMCLLLNSMVQSFLEAFSFMCPNLSMIFLEAPIAQDTVKTFFKTIFSNKPLQNCRVQCTMFSRNAAKLNDFEFCLRAPDFDIQPDLFSRFNQAVYSSGFSFEMKATSLDAPSSITEAAPITTVYRRAQEEEHKIEAMRVIMDAVQPSSQMDHLKEKLRCTSLVHLRESPSYENSFKSEDIYSHLYVHEYYVYTCFKCQIVQSLFHRNLEDLQYST